MNDLVFYPLLPYLAAAKAKVNTLLHFLDTYDDPDLQEETYFPYQGLFHYSSTSSHVEELVPFPFAIPTLAAIANYRFLCSRFAFYSEEVLRNGGFVFKG